MPTLRLRERLLITDYLLMVHSRCPRPRPTVIQISIKCVQNPMEICIILCVWAQWPLQHNSFQDIFIDLYLGLGKHTIIFKKWRYFWWLVESLYWLGPGFSLYFHSLFRLVSQHSTRRQTGASGREKGAHGVVNERIFASLFWAISRVLNKVLSTKPARLNRPYVSNE